MAALRDQPDAVSVALDAQAVAIVLDLVEPLRAGRNQLSNGRQAELEFRHDRHMGMCCRFCESAAEAPMWRFSGASGSRPGEEELIQTPIDDGVKSREKAEIVSPGFTWFIFGPERRLG
ncbi:hypothetical protein ACVIHH_005149 [Bradyrhizobium sp. USDA 4518]|nr:hypothetical protein [Bradyrhizobium elkanii]